MYKNRIDAGQKLAEYLRHLAMTHPTLLAIPRGGVVVAQPVAKVLQVPINILATQKIGHPKNDEVAIGAVLPDGSAVWDKHVIDAIGISPDYLNKLVIAKFFEIQRRLKTYTGTDKPVSVDNQTVILVDDGIATGYTIRAAVEWLKSEGASKVIVAVPVAPRDTVDELKKIADEVVCPLTPEPFYAVGLYYNAFDQTSDQEVLDILQNQTSQELS